MDNNATSWKKAVQPYREQDFFFCAPKFYSREGVALEPLAVTGIKRMVSLENGTRLVAPQSTDFYYQSLFYYFRVVEGMYKVYESIAQFAQKLGLGLHCICMLQEAGQEFVAQLESAEFEGDGRAGAGHGEVDGARLRQRIRARESRDAGDRRLGGHAGQQVGSIL